MRDYNDYSQETSDPFRRGRLSQQLRWMRLVGARKFHNTTRPLRTAWRWLMRCAAGVASLLEQSFGRATSAVARMWFRLTRRVPFGSMRRQVSSLQNSVVRSVDDLTFTVRERTTRATWMRRLRSRLALFAARIHRVWIEFVTWAETSWFTRLITAPLRWSAQAAYTIADFVIGWIGTRQYRHLLFGIPAIILVMPLAYCAVRLPFYTTQAKARHYRRAASEAMAAADYNSAELYFRKLAQLGDVHEQVTWRAALLSEEQGRIDEAYRQMRQIAPLTEPGMPEAHLWIAQRISSGELERDNPQAAQWVEQHVRHAMARQLSDPTLNVWLARIYFSSGQSDKCLALLDKTRLTELPWRARVGAADLYAQLGHLQRGRMVAAGAVDYFQQQQQAGAELTADDYLSWAAAAELDGHTGDAVDVLLEALEAPAAHTDGSKESDASRERLRAALADIGLAHFDDYRALNSEEWDARLRLLERLLRALPDREPALQRLVQLTLLPDVAERAERLLQAEQEAGPLPAAVEKVRGDVAIIKGNWAAARRHYQWAVERDATTHAALNNLAYLRAHHEPIDLEQAMSLADRAVALEPDNPHYLETRGQILIRLERWPEAVADLTIALNGMPTKREIHASLARAYQQLGEPETANLHAARAGE